MFGAGSRAARGSQRVRSVERRGSAQPRGEHRPDPLLRSAAKFNPTTRKGVITIAAIVLVLMLVFLIVVALGFILGR
jgi:hypothetical protein